MQPTGPEAGEAPSQPPPLEIRDPNRLSSPERWGVAAAAAALGLVFVVAWWVNPNPSGLGSHMQLGLPPCNLERFVGIPCPFCGMTTAFSLMMRGDFGLAFWVQPAGAGLFVVALTGFILSMGIAISGRIPRAIVNHPSVIRWTWILAVVMISGSWLYKIAVTQLN